jgi:hypothetical protein
MRGGNRRFTDGHCQAAGWRPNGHAATLYDNKVIFHIFGAPSLTISPALSGGLAMPGPYGLLTGRGA